MGDNRQNSDGPPPARDAAARFAAMLRPLLVKGVAFARTLPGHARDLADRIDMPRRIADSRKWIDAQDFPGKTQWLGKTVAETGRGAMAASRRGADATQATAGPVLTAAGRKMAGAVRTIAERISGRSVALGAALARRRAMADNRRTEAAGHKATRDAARAAEVPPAPVPSELMRLLKEEGVAVEGMDVREALPEPVRPGSAAAQGALPLFADDPIPPTPPSRPVFKEEVMPATPPPPPIAPRTPPAQPQSAASSPSTWAALKTMSSALFTSTNDRPFYQNRTFQMTIGATAFLATASAAALFFMQGGAAPSVSGALDRAQVETIVRDYILEHPEIIPEAIERLQVKRMSSVVDSHRSELETPFAGGFDGAKDGDVVLVEFFDYACGYCRASLPDIDRLLAEDKNLKVVYRDLPILSEESGKAAKASLYAAKQGQYGEFHRALYAAGQLSQESIDVAARKAGMDPAKMKTAMQAGDISAEIEKNLRLAQALQATGTPTWVVGDQILSGAVGYDALKAAIAKARASGS